MKPSNFLRRFVLAIFCLAALHMPVIAEASIITDIADLLVKLNEPLTGQGITSGGLKGAESLFTCLEEGTSVDTCAAKFTQGQDDVELPDWLESFVDFYVAYMSGDVWGALYSLGEEAVCLLAPIVTGVDVCALVKALIAAAEAIYGAAETAYNMAEDVMDFFGLGIVWDALEDAVADLGCAVTFGLWGCDDDAPRPPPIPPADQLCYGLYYAPSITNGAALQWIKAMGESKYDLEVGKLNSAANGFGNKAACNTAVERFHTEVDTLWTNDLIQNVLPVLGLKRAEYNAPNTPQVGLIAQQWLAANTPDWNGHYYDGVKNSTVVGCSHDFISTYGFEHVDRWIKKHKTGNSIHLQSNEVWCQDVFWVTHISEFATFFKDYLTQNNICKTNGNSLVCDSYPHYDRCLQVLTDVGAASSCTLSTEAIMEAATKVYDEMVYYGSVHIDKPVKPKVNINNNGKVMLKTSRPTTQQVCEMKAKKYPGNFVVCVLQEDPDYKSLKTRVAQIMAILEKGGSAGLHPQVSLLGPQSGGLHDGSVDKSKVTLPCSNKVWTGSILLPGILSPVPEPLIVNAEPCVVNKVRSDPNQNFGFGTPSMKPGFNFDLQGVNPIDGASTPVLREVDIDPEQVKAGVQKMLEDKSKTGISVADRVQNSLTKDGKPKIDPINQLSRESLKDKSSLQFGNQTGSLAAKGVQDARTKFGSAASTQAGNQGAKATLTESAKGGFEAQKKLQNSSVASPGMNNINMPSGSSQQTPMSAPMQLPDLTATDTVTIAGKTLRQTTRWNTPVVLDAKEATRSVGGMCSFAVQYSLRNLGSGPAMPFKSVLTSSATNQPVIRTWNGIAANTTSAPASDSITLKPGQNQLTLAIQVNEPNQANNQFLLPVTLNGTCAEQRRIIAPSKR